MGLKRARPCVYLHRAAAAHLRSFVSGATPTNAAKAMFGNDSATDLVLRAARRTKASFGACTGRDPRCFVKFYYHS